MIVTTKILNQFRAWWIKNEWMMNQQWNVNFLLQLRLKYLRTQNHR
jgi:hypothetical protein